MCLGQERGPAIWLQQLIREDLCRIPAKTTQNITKLGDIGVRLPFPDPCRRDCPWSCPWYLGRSARNLSAGNGEMWGHGSSCQAARAVSGQVGRHNAGGKAHQVDSMADSDGRGQGAQPTR
jgi:hypothetical protein